MAGASAPENFNTHGATFQNCMKSFKELTNAAMINRKPERIALKTLNRAMTLQQALASYNVPSARNEEMAILNGMQLADQVPAGTILKIPERR